MDNRVPADGDGHIDSHLEGHSDPAEDRRGELALEQEYVSMLYGRLDTLRDRTADELRQVFRRGTNGTHQGRSERDSLATLYTDRLAQLSAVEHGLCFGRLDRTDETRFYIGRVGLSDDDYEPLLIDWRAPVAQPFYRATPAAPDGVLRRRYLRTRSRQVVSIDDDVLDLASLTDRDRATLNGEAALLASLTASRTGRMNDIVATIQVEQDRIIRSDVSGILVVQGGPGTGKTVVALHRAAYLLYTHRERLARRGVLVIGPNTTFLRYIEQVLPSLGETDVVLSTLGSLYPGVTATALEPPAVAALKGDPRMADVIAAAVRDRQEVPETVLELTVDREVLRLDRRTCEKARTRARRSRRLHNQARAVFEREIVAALARQMVRRSGGGLLDPADVHDIRADVAAEPQVRAVLDRLWPRLSPQQLLADLYAAPHRIAAAAPHLTAAERALLVRIPTNPTDPTDPTDPTNLTDPAAPAADPDAGWSAADVPLLDEAAEVLGEDDAAAERAEVEDEEERRREIAYARGVLTMLDLDSFMEVDPGLLVDQYRRRGDDLTTAERAGEDRRWAFGHVIVDEAQELSPMAWRMVMRRCPSRSMTVVGDIAQTGSLAGARSWAQVLSPYAVANWRQSELTINYRTPVEIMAVAADVLAGVDPALAPPTSVRESGERPWARRLSESGFAAEFGALLAAEVAEVGDGRLAVLVPLSRRAELARLVTDRLPTAAVGQGAGALDATVAVLTVQEAKGLEFDGVLVVDPAAILAESPRGGSDLYVAVTRATRRLGVVHTGELPDVLSAVRAPGPPTDDTADNRGGDADVAPPRSA